MRANQHPDYDFEKKRLEETQKASIHTLMNLKLVKSWVSMIGQQLH